ncbi:MAG: zinc ribbon domain-containing protein [Kiritimatiellae bacterium]|nr:zinc ribbon domain-containing protein [Kiritimatiellia bacterium]
MPVYEYIAINADKSCDFCLSGFDERQALGSPVLNVCPRCGAPVRKAISRVAIGHSKSSLDDRAKAAGFRKLKKIGRGEYEKQY